jgi:tRNA1(Val) A37 N6-methylase TrmN6
MIYHPFRLAELVSLLRESRLEPKRMRFVHSRADEEAKMVMIEAIKGGGVWLKVDPPLYLYEKGNDYTREAQKILKV